MNDFSKRLGQRLRNMRDEVPLREFAPKLGLDARALNRIESGTQNVTLETLATICRHLNCTAGSLIDEQATDHSAKKSAAKKKTASPRKKPS